MRIPQPYVTICYLSNGYARYCNVARKPVELYDFSERPLDVRWNGMLLPYRVFRKDQRAQSTSHRGDKRLSPR